MDKDKIERLIQQVAQNEAKLNLLLHYAERKPKGFMQKVDRLLGYLERDPRNLIWFDALCFDGSAEHGDPYLDDDGDSIIVNEHADVTEEKSSRSGNWVSVSITPNARPADVLRALHKVAKAIEEKPGVLTVDPLRMLENVTNGTIKIGHVDLGLDDEIPF